MNEWCIGETIKASTAASEHAKQTVKPMDEISERRGLSQPNTKQPNTGV
jgi:hypothetical protein